MTDSAVSQRDWTRLKSIMLEVYKGKCQYCLERSGEQIDHIHPKAKGGTDDLNNLILACGKCNGRKQAGLIAETYLGLISAIADRHSGRIAAKMAERKLKPGERIVRTRKWVCTLTGKELVINRKTTLEQKRKFLKELREDWGAYEAQWLYWRGCKPPIGIMLN